MELPALVLQSDGVLTRRELRAGGMSRRALSAAVREGELRRRGKRVFVAAASVSHEAVRVAVRELGAVASHQDAAQLWGLELAHESPERHVTVARNASRRVLRGTRVHRADLGTDDVEQRDGIRVTSVVRTLMDLCRLLPIAEAVAVIDSALRRGLSTPEELTGALQRLPRAPGRARVRHALALMDPSSGSVLESLCRVLLTGAGLGPDTTQAWIRDSCGSIGRVDFAWLSARLVIETDGFAFHSDRQRYRADRRRGNRLALAGWRLLRFSWEDVVHEPELVVAQVRAALAMPEP